MIRIRRAEDRGHFDHGWLDTHHTFSFSRYYDPQHVGFRALRVINEDRVRPGQGFGTHPHEDMEIVTYVLDGAIAHKDSSGGGSVLRPGEFQHMTAGTGIHHSEFNPSADEPVHFYQIWLEPTREGLAPGYDQKAFPEAERENRWRLVASPDGAEGSLTVQADARMYLANLDPATILEHAIASGRHAWLQVLRGDVTLGDQTLKAGDGVAISDERSLAITASARSEVLLFDLA